MAPRKPKRGELAVIEQIREAAERLPRPASLRLGMGDDCAILAPAPGTELVVTTDFSLEGRHFVRDKHPAYSVGHRVLARGLSDLAAMGATPVAAFLSLALPKDLSSGWLGEFLNGLLALGRLTGTPLAGGDTSESPSPHILADITLLGSVPAGLAMRRSGAQLGDGLYVTGSLGGAASELARVLAGKKLARLIPGEHPHLLPQPRLDVGQKLRAKATAAIDISDGLSTDLTHLCQASGVSAELDLSALPVGRGATIEQALHGGEDYELLFTAKPGTRMPPQIGGVSITRIGTILPLQRNLITALGPGGSRRPLEAAGWEHLR